jgi:DNA-directed RNA polymerase subunit beta'
VAGAGNSTAAGYKRIDQILKMPDIVSGSATLAPVTGTVTRIDKGVGGGFNVFVGTAKAYVSSGLALSVKVGDEVKAGDALSEGVAKPQDLVRLKGMQPAQQYMVDALHSAYKAQGVVIQKRVFETIVRSLGNTTQVLNNPKDSGHLPGDIAPYTVIQAYNRNLTGTVPVDEAEGYALAAAQGGFDEGHVVAASDLRTLRSRGVTDVKVTKEAIKHAPFLKGITTLPILKRNWMASLGYRNLAKALTEGASQGWTTDLAGEHPVPALAHGASFGKGKEGKY